MKTTSLIWLAGLTLLGGCLPTTDGGGDDTSVDSADSDTQDTDVVVNDPTWNEGYWTPDWKAFVDCSTSASPKFIAETNNWGGDVHVYFAQTDNYGGFRAWDEVHTLEETDHSAAQDGYSHYERTLTAGATIEGQTTDVSTVFNCTGETGLIDPTDAKFEVTFALAVWAPGDATTGAPSDCIVFGNDAQGMLDDPNGPPLGEGNKERELVPSWVNDTNCRKVGN